MDTVAITVLFHSEDRSTIPPKQPPYRTMSGGSFTIPPEKGENVWVTIGKTDHMAVYIGDKRECQKTLVKVRGKRETLLQPADKYEVLVRYTTGTKSYVPCSSVRSIVADMRRKRQRTSVELYSPQGDVSTTSTGCSASAQKRNSSKKRSKKWKKLRWRSSTTRRRSTAST